MVYNCERPVAHLRRHSFCCLWAANVRMVNHSLGTNPEGNQTTGHCNKCAATWCPVSESKHDLFFEDARRIERHFKYTVFSRAVQIILTPGFVERNTSVTCYHYYLNSKNCYKKTCGQYEVSAYVYFTSAITTSRSWLRASSMIKLNKNQPDAHQF
jgi:hypothetical protein